MKVDSYVVETNVHYPTDVNLLYDSGRKCLDQIKKASQAMGKPLPGWRKVNHWHRKLRKQERKLTTILGRGGRNRATRVVSATEAYLETAGLLSTRIDQTKISLSTSDSIQLLAIVLVLEHYQELLNKHIDLVRRRLLESEIIPPSRQALFDL